MNQNPNRLSDKDLVRVVDELTQLKYRIETASTFQKPGLLKKAGEFQFQITRELVAREVERNG